MLDDSRPLDHILIVGAGLAGLALGIGLRKSGYQVTIVERDTVLEDVGAGIQLPANSTQILSELGVLQQIQEFCVQPSDLVIHSYRGSKLFEQNLSPTIEKEFRFPHLLIHRADLRRVLYNTAIAAGAEVRLGKPVVEIDFQAVSISLKPDEKLSADLIVGADGEHSLTRAALLGRKATPSSSGDVVYRLSIPLAAMEAESNLRYLVDPPCVHAWYGPGSHAVCYRLEKGSIFNVVITLPEIKGTATIGPQPANSEDLQLACRLWDPRIRRLLSLTERALKWTLLETESLDSLNHSTGRFVLLGDSAHATLPYLAQGAALAFESACILSLLLARHPPLAALPGLLNAFSVARIPRAAAIRDRSKQMHDLCQLTDGPSQIERDRVLREERPFEGFPNPWADPKWADFMWRFDAKAEAEQIWSRCFS